MEQPTALARSTISSRLKALGRDRAWLAESLHVSEGVVNQWLSPKGVFPMDRFVAVKMLLESAENPVRIGDPDGNLLSFTIEEFEHIEATRQSLHYDSRPELYRDAILAFVEQDEANQSKILPMAPDAVAAPLEAERLVAENQGPKPLLPPRNDVVYESGHARRPSR